MKSPEELFNIPYDKNKDIFTEKTVKNISEIAILKRIDELQAKKRELLKKIHFHKNEALKEKLTLDYAHADLYEKSLRRMLLRN